jgi:DNA-binding transcriptional ArsR family regulator
LPARKIRVEVYDDSGNRYTITLEGKISRENVLKILDIVELLGAMHREQYASRIESNLTKFEKILSIIENSFSSSWFSAKDVKAEYENITGEHIGLSTVSTYLSRLSSRGLLTKQKISNRIRYRLVVVT